MGQPDCRALTAEDAEDAEEGLTVVLKGRYLILESLADSRSCLGNPYLFSALRVMHAPSHAKSAKVAKKDRTL